jgi:hypothetical protein
MIRCTPSVVEAQISAAQNNNSNKVCSPASNCTHWGPSATAQQQQLQGMQAAKHATQDHFLVT